MSAEAPVYCRSCDHTHLVGTPCWWAGDARVAVSPPRVHSDCSKPMSRACSMEEHTHCSGIFKTADAENLDVTHQCGCKCHLPASAPSRREPADLPAFSEAQLEIAAAWKHTTWARWTLHLLKSYNPDNVARWQRQIDTPYAELSDEDKEKDRREVRALFALLLPPEDRP